MLVMHGAGNNDKKRDRMCTYSMFNKVLPLAFAYENIS